MRDIYYSIGSALAYHFIWVKENHENILLYISAVCAAKVLMYLFPKPKRKSYYE